jgi:hypothetical protein
MSDTITTFTQALKEYYSPDMVENLIIKDQPFYAKVKKDNNFVGKDYYRVPMVWAPSAGVSSNFTKGMANALATSNQVNEFQVKRVKTYSFGYIDAELILAADGKASAFVDAAKLTVDNIIVNLSRDIGICMYRDGWGTRGQIKTGSAVTGKTITLSRASDAFNFEVGQRLDVTAAIGSAAAARAHGTSTNALIVTGVDRDAGILTFAYNVNDATNGIPAIAADDYICLEGDISTSKVKLTGLAGWLPDTMPSSGDSFYGLDRSVDTRLAGLRLDASGGLTLIEALNKAVVKVAQVGGKADTALVSFPTYANIINALEGKFRYTEHGEGDIGFTGIEVLTSRGKVDVLPDVNCPDDHMYVLQLNTWKLCSLKEDLHRISEDGLEMLRSSSADAFEIRYRFSGGLACTAPGFNCAVLLSK